MADSNNLERLVVRNAAGEAAPPYAIAEVSGAEDFDGESRLVIRKPTGSGQVVAVGPAGIAAGGVGYAFRGTPFVLVGTSTVGTVCKATSGSWIATTGGASAAGTNTADSGHTHAATGLSGPSHTHDVGTLAGGAHTHDYGTLAATAEGVRESAAGNPPGVSVNFIIRYV